MYGIIHKALKEMVVRDFGQEKWEKIESEAAQSKEIFVSMQPYSDDIVYALIGAASKELGAPVDECLQMFGRYWILDAAPESYSNILDATGSEIVHFIQNINSLHDRITSTFPDYVPPEFFIEPIGESLYKINYLSTRAGLSPFVVGLLQGLGTRFDTEIDIQKAEQIECDSGEEWAFTVHIPG